MAPVDETFSQLQGFVARSAAELSQGVERGWHGAVARFDAARRNPVPFPLPLASIAGVDRRGQAADGQAGGFRLPDRLRALQTVISGGRPKEVVLEPKAPRRRRVPAADGNNEGLVLVSNKAYDGDGSATDARRNQLPTIRTSLSRAMEATYAGRQRVSGAEADVDSERGRGRREGGAVLAGSALKARDGRRFEELDYINDDNYDEDDDGALAALLRPPPPSPLAADGSSLSSAAAAAAASSASSAGGARAGAVVVSSPGGRRQAGQQRQQQAGGVRMGADGAEEWAGPAPDFLKKAAQEAGPATKEELGRATWTFLHTLAAQFPEKPSKQQQKDAREFVTLLARVYPCKICSYHFQKIVKANPPQAGSRGELEQYMCRLHNIVNRRYLR
ncbi:unnamed protein product [Closterium sp. NIES-64]|nr:unnamed protein product [Closterium sp. NIES-64]CAI5996858.1 unnamed protein product [Closterium sp. NIES-65]CAI6005309.1 unnamed protein product [Closterium sp. NIES-64]